MEKKRENIKRRRFSASAAAAAAALVLIPAGTVGAIHFASSGSKNSGEKYGAQVETTTVTETLAAEEASAAGIEASAINEDNGEEVSVAETTEFENDRFQPMFANIPENYKRNNDDGIKVICEETGGCAAIVETTVFDDLETYLADNLTLSAEKRRLTNYNYERTVYYLTGSEGTEAVIVFGSINVAVKVQINSAVSEEDMWALLGEVNVAILE